MLSSGSVWFLIILCIGIAIIPDLIIILVENFQENNIISFVNSNNQVALENSGSISMKTVVENFSLASIPVVKSAKSSLAFYSDNSELDFVAKNSACNLSAKSSNSLRRTNRISSGHVITTKNI